MRLCDTIIKELNSGLESYFKNKFYHPDPKKGKHMKLDVRCYGEGIYWNMANVDYSMGFKLNGHGNLIFFAKLKFPKKQSMKKELKKTQFYSGNVIENSKFLGRPARDYGEGHYFVECKVKRLPEKKKLLHSHIYGYLLKDSMITIHGRKN